MVLLCAMSICERIIGRHTNFFGAHESFLLPYHIISLTGTKSVVDPRTFIKRASFYQTMGNSMMEILISMIRGSQLRGIFIGSVDVVAMIALSFKMK